MTLLLRRLRADDLERLTQIYKDSGLPHNCFPHLDEGFAVRQIAEIDGTICVGAFVRPVGEGYIICAHDIGTPQERWEALKQVIDSASDAARLKGLPDITAWLPDEVAKSFGPRLEELGFRRGTWVCYSRMT